MGCCMKADSRLNVMLTAIALTGALCLLATAHQTPIASERPRTMQVSPRVDDATKDIAHRKPNLFALDWLLNLNRGLKPTSQI
jgi:hypothetical protein